jgi:Holliday junction resolvasome RuvABC endonuclease subunit
MITLGIRAKPDSITFAIIDIGVSNIVNVETVKIPKALPNPEALKYLRNTILDILREYKVERAGIRITESNAQQLNIRRLQIEGVIQEAFASSDLDAYFCGQISSISARLGFDRSYFKPYVDGDRRYEEVENWASLSKEEREAVLTALGAEHA